MGATVAALFFSLFNNLMQLILPAMMAMMINTGIDDGRIGLVRLLGGAMAALSAIAIGAAVAGSYYSSKVSACFGLSLRRAIFVKVESLSQCDIDKIGTPSLITRTTNDIRQIQDMVLMMIRIIISAPIVMVGGAVMAFTLNKRLSTVMFIAIPIILVIALFVAKQVMPMFDKAQKKTRKKKPSAVLLLVLTVLIVVVGVEIVNVYGRLKDVRAQEAALTQQLQEKAQANEALRSDLCKKDDPEFIKALARDLLGVAEEGERIFYDVND